MKETTRHQILAGEIPKGEVLAVSRVAGIQAAKRTGELIPLCHPLPVEQVSVDFSWATNAPANQAALVVHSEATISSKTGVEMEALTAASVAALTIYDMCKGVDRGMIIQSIRLLEKSGGQSGHWVAEG